MRGIALLDSVPTRALLRTCPSPGRHDAHPWRSVAAVGAPAVDEQRSGGVGSQPGQLLDRPHRIRRVPAGKPFDVTALSARRVVMRFPRDAVPRGAGAVPGMDQSGGRQGFQRAVGGGGMDGVSGPRQLFPDFRDRQVAPGNREQRQDVQPSRSATRPVLAQSNPRLVRRSRAVVFRLRRHAQACVSPRLIRCRNATRLAHKGQCEPLAAAKVLPWDGRDALRVLGPMPERRLWCVAASVQLHMSGNYVGGRWTWRFTRSRSFPTTTRRWHR